MSIASNGRALLRREQARNSGAFNSVRQYRPRKRLQGPATQGETGSSRSSKDQSWFVPVKRFFALDGTSTTQPNSQIGAAAPQCKALDGDALSKFIRSFAKGYDATFVDQFLLDYNVTLDEASGACVLEEYIIVEPRAPAPRHTIIIRDVVLSEEDHIDLSELAAQIDLHFEKCSIPIVDAYSSKLGSLHFAGVSSEYGTWLFCVDANLDALSISEFGTSNSFFQLLDARGATIDDVSLSGGAEFSCRQYFGKLASFVASEASGADAQANQIDTLATNIAEDISYGRQVIDLRHAIAERISIASKCIGAVLLSDAKVKEIVGIHGGPYENAAKEAVAALKRVLNVLPSWTTGAARQNVSNLIKKLLVDRAACLDLHALSCNGLIEFTNCLGAVGIIDLSDAKCEGFKDDHTVWLKETRSVWTFLGFAPSVRFDLRNFEYKQLRYDAQTENRSKAPSGIKTRRGALSAKQDGGEIAEQMGEKAWWLRGSMNAVNRELPRLRRTGVFDSQPWTHCVSVLRSSGWRQAAEDVSYYRELHSYKANSPPLYQRLIGTAFFVPALVVLFFAWYQESLSHKQGGDLSLLVGLTAAILGLGMWTRWFRAAGSFLIRWTVGFGYRAGIAALLSIGVVLAGSILFALAYSDDPNATYLIRNPSSQAPGSKPTRPQPRNEGDQAASVEMFVGGQAYQFASDKDYRLCDGEDKAECDLHPYPAPTNGEVPKEGGEVPPPDAPQPSDGATADSYPRFNPLMYSLDVFIPLIDFSQGTYWIPGRPCKTESGTTGCPSAEFVDGIQWPLALGDVTTDPMDSGEKVLVWLGRFFSDSLTFYSLWYWFEIAAGWWLTVVLAASLGGWFERKQ